MRGTLEIVREFLPPPLAVLIIAYITRAPEPLNLYKKHEERRAIQFSLEIQLKRPNVNNIIEDRILLDMSYMNSTGSYPVSSLCLRLVCDEGTLEEMCNSSVALEALLDRMLSNNDISALGVMKFSWSKLHQAGSTVEWDIGMASSVFEKTETIRRCLCQQVSEDYCCQ